MAKYLPLSHRDSTDEKQEFNISPSNHAFRTIWKDIALVLLTVLCLILAIANLRIPARYEAPAADTSLLSAEVDIQRWVPSHFFSDYSSSIEDGKAGMEVVDRNWKAINAAHGYVAVDHQWAAENGLLSADDWAGDASKGIYMIEAYHAIHCIKIIRQTMFQLARRQPLDVPFGHSTHCFDQLRQHVMCRADDTLMYHRVNQSSGDGQMRKCRNWGALNKWASNSSACYVDGPDSNPILDIERCPELKDRGDGLIIRNWPET